MRYLLIYRISNTGLVYFVNKSNIYFPSSNLHIVVNREYETKEYKLTNLLIDMSITEKERVARAVDPRQKYIFRWRKDYAYRVTT